MSKSIISLTKKQIIAVFIMLLLFGVSIAQGYNILFMATVFLVALVFFFCMHNPYKHFALMFFVCTYFFFLMSSEFVQEVFNVVNLREVTEEASVHSLIVILLGLIFLLIGYQFTITRSFSQRVHNEKYVDAVRRVSKIIMYITFIVYISETLDMFLYIQKNSYLTYFLNYQSKIPSIIIQIGDMSPVAFAIFTATFPSKKQCKVPFLFFAVNGIISLFSGKRYEGIAIILFIIAYCLIRNRRDKETWISKKMIIILVGSVPLICLGLYFISYVRLGMTYNNSTSMLDNLLSFFNSAGESNKVIKYGYMYKDRIPNGRFYSLGGLIDYFKYNKITCFITGETMTRSQTVEYAMAGNNFSSVLTYIVMPQRYLQGNGLGSCYLAELYQDLGYSGVIIGSLIYGILIKNIFKINGHIWHNSICFYIFTSMLKAPRDSFDCFLQEIINMKFILFFVFIMVLSNHFYSRKIKG